MPKSVDIDDFAAKLGLVIKRLDWGRAKLAQQVGVDKSLAGRWVNGESRPTPHSLTRLTSAVAGTITGLTSSDWDLSLDQFARRIGVDSPTPVAAEGDGAARLTIGGLKYPPPIDWGEPYIGLWAGVYHSLVKKGRLHPFAIRFFVNDLGLRCEATEGNFSGEGPALVTRSHV